MATTEMKFDKKKKRKKILAIKEEVSQTSREREKGVGVVGRRELESRGKEEEMRDGELGRKQKKPK